MLKAFAAALLLAPPVALSGPARVADKRTKDVLVGAHYFSGWWEPKPNKWLDPADGSDWRARYPGRVPLLGEYNTQATMDREIEAAASHGVDYFSILWYFLPPGREVEPNARRLNAGLEQFMASPRAGRMAFCIELCNHAPFVVKSEEDWAACIREWLPAFRHPSYLRVGRRLVFKVHSLYQFLEDTGKDPARGRARHDALRAAVREAGLGEMLIGCGVMAGDVVRAGDPAARLFDFSNTYMDVPPLPPQEQDHPYGALAGQIRRWRGSQAESALPYVPFLSAGWCPRPWRDRRPAFAFPTREEWEAELRQMAADLERQPRFGLPLPDGGRVKVFTIYAWNEFGEGGILAPNKAEGAMKLETLKALFAASGGER
jgi:hypothetical protein